MRRITQVIRNLILSIKFPFRCFDYLAAYSGVRSKMAELTGHSIKEINFFYNEIFASSFFKDIVRRSGVPFGVFYLNMFVPFRAPSLYVLCRIFKPDTVIETGVADGFSTAFILQAIDINQKGHLYSIDSPNQPGQELGQGKFTGWLVDKRLKKYWTLIIGDSKTNLPKLLTDLKDIDVFYHDSDHSYENMSFELKTALPHLKKNGCIIADDITDSTAFNDFCKEAGSKYARLFKFGIMKVSEGIKSK